MYATPFSLLSNSFENYNLLKLRNWVSTWLPLVSATLTFVNYITSNCSSTIPLGRLPWQEDFASRLVSPFKIFWWVWYSCKQTHTYIKLWGVSYFWYCEYLTLTNLSLVLTRTCRWRHVDWVINVGGLSRATFVAGNSSEQVLLALNNIGDCVFLVLQTCHYLKTHKHKESDHWRFTVLFQRN